MNPYHTLAAEKKELEDTLAEIPAANVIERASFEARLKAVCQSLEGLETPALVKKGTISPEIESPEELNGLLRKMCTVTFDVVQVGQGRPKYTLPKMEVTIQE